MLNRNNYKSNAQISSYIANESKFCFMRRLVFLIAFCLFLTNQVYSQEVIRLPDGTSIDELEAPYISVYPCVSLRAGLPYRVQIEYLSRLRPLSQNEFIYDSYGQVLFDSKTAILNFMHQKGYKLAQAVIDNEGEVKYYLMERRITKPIE
jgi:hypothetical protein